MTITTVWNSSGVKYFREAKTELEKVSWPTRKDTVLYSILVATVSIATALFIGALDLGLSKGLEALITIIPA
jgi:preprotein translocase subunit SecE